MVIQWDKGRETRTVGLRLLQCTISGEAAECATRLRREGYRPIDRPAGRRGIGSIVMTIAVASAVGAGGATAHPRRHHRIVASIPTPVRAAPIAAPTRAAPSFYPENVEGGVPGNLSFNNQIRKLTDPLNANGGR